MSNLQYFLEEPIAHQGLVWKKLQENSLFAILVAVEEGIGIEIDVRLTKDGKIVLFHDRDIRKIADNDIKVNELSYEDLQSLCAKKGITLTTLEAVLQVVDGKVPLLVEIKNEGIPGRLERKIWDLLSSYDGPVALQSFNPFSLLLMKILMKGSEKVPVGMLTTSFTNDGPHDHEVPAAVKALLKSHLLTLLCHPDFLACDVRDLPNFYLKLIAYVQQTPIIAWTVTDKETWRLASDADNFIGEGPPLFMDRPLDKKPPNSFRSMIDSVRNAVRNTAGNHREEENSFRNTP